jgi:hypothetical protein
MIVFELICAKHHRFEGWFASADQFADQQGKGHLECPTCGTRSVEKLLTSKIRRQEASASSQLPVPSKNVPVGVPQQAAQLSPAKLNEMIDFILTNTENVGPRFAEEARRIHNDEAPVRDIRGTATKEETEQLLEDGIPVLPLPIPSGEIH